MKTIRSFNPLSTLNQCYESRYGRIFFCDEPHEVDCIPLLDSREFGIPDYIQNIAIQLDCFVEIMKTLGFAPPWQGLKNIGQKIDVHVSAFNGNGLALQKPIYFPKAEIKNDLAFFIIKINNKLHDFPGNYWTVVAHEVFHLYQFILSDLRVSWYLESTANWAERLLRFDESNPKYAIPLPQDKVSLEENIFNVPYNAIWYRLAYLTQKDKVKIGVPEEIKAISYVDGSKVVRVKDWGKLNLLLHFLNNLSRLPAHDIDSLSKLDQNRIVFDCLKLTIRETTILYDLELDTFLKISL
ncbi:hypothetical protein [Acinetobacter sp. YH12023]|uniref:hypothetical protein n=1 Tax=Acinetobacter sp. YH12023 TaxID=2601041 RepID=UPI0015D41DAF|nr:hypothetical protein [Acinetobacter sp. YH12023]